MNILLIPTYGVIGAALSTVVSEVFLLGCYFYVVKSYSYKKETNGC